MQGADIAIVVLVVVAVAGSAYGVVTYDAGGPTPWDVVVTVAEAEPDLAVLDGTAAASGTPVTDTWSNDVDNVTEVDFSVVVTGSTNLRLQNTVVVVEITSPNGITKEARLTLPQGATQTTDGAIAFGTEDLGDVPASLENVDAVNQSAAVQLIPTNTNGTGAWQISARVDQTNSLAPESVNVEVTVDRYESYMANAAAHTPDVGLNA